MNQTTKETRRRSYDAVLPKRAARCRRILALEPDVRTACTACALKGLGK